MTRYNWNNITFDLRDEQPVSETEVAGADHLEEEQEDLSSYVLGEAEVTEAVGEAQETNTDSEIMKENNELKQRIALLEEEVRVLKLTAGQAE